MSRAEIARRAGLAGSTITRMASGEIPEPNRRAVRAVLAVRP